MAISLKSAALACLVLLLGLSFQQCTETPPTVTIFCPYDHPQIDFGIEEIAGSLSTHGIKLQETDSPLADLIIELTQDEVIQAEGFVIKKEKQKQIINAVDTAGLMYACLELAEQLRTHKIEDIEDISQNPYMKMRGTKFNLPLDARSPSYTDASDPAQKNMEVVWDFDFWKDYIDELANHRYNFISCWSLHPFPSLVKLPDYPEIALDNVLQSKVRWKEYYSLGAQGLDDPEILDSCVVLREMTIEDKITFWKQVMAYGKSRNVDFYFITWNIFTNGTYGKYGITTDADNLVTQDYFRKSVAQMFRTYPDLAGIGLTTGENMKGLSFEQKEDWAYSTYAKGILEVAKEMPERQFTFIHRQHQADPKYIEEKFQPVIDQENIDFIYSFKYAKAHVFSATKQPYHEEFAKNIGTLKTIWTLRNDDAYYFRWGSPEFVREFVKNIPYEISQGVYYGSDQWIWGRVFTDKHISVPGQLEIQKHWYHWMLWGRLSYNPNLTNNFFINILGNKFPGVDAKTLYEAWHHASMIYPTTTAFHWGRVDFMWYIEGCRSRPHIAKNESGFHDVNTFIAFPVHDKSGNQTIPDYVQMQLEKRSTELHTPLDVAQQLHHHAEQAQMLLGKLSGGDDVELAATLKDIEIISLMGKYYAHKISGSTYLALYRATQNQEDQNRSIQELKHAQDYWKRYSSLARDQYINPIWLNRVGYVDWEKTGEWVAQDIAIASND